MFRKILNVQLAWTEPGRVLHRFRPVVDALDAFFYEPAIETKGPPHIRDAVDVKRWMMVVVIALLPVLFMSIWNTGLQSFVYGSGDHGLMAEYLKASTSFSAYLDFAFSNGRWWPIVKLGAFALLPVVLISYAVGGLCEAMFAVVRKHEITEGFLVTGILYALILPPTIPYWMVAVGVAFGIILSKEVFGGSGMNIVNPALACRALLFFTFPGKMSGDVWVGTNPTVIRKSLMQMNLEAGNSVLDGYSQATWLARFNVSPEIKRVHVDAIASQWVGNRVDSYATVQQQFNQWNAAGHHQAALGALDGTQLQQFVTMPLVEGGLGLPSGSYQDAYHFASLNYGLENASDWNFFLGNKLGCMGETSVLACLLGALLLVWTGVGSWRSMTGMALGAFLTALLFEYGAKWAGMDSGAWNPAIFSFPAYKHLLLGGLAFGAVFMITDPVSSPGMNLSRWVYGGLAGCITIVIRVSNPAYPEGVMLAILMANVFAPLIDYYVVRYSRKQKKKDQSCVQS